ncbi:MAG: type 4a pilus biogenesis protein PilO [Bdellovibrionia bacterium]
MNLSSLRELFTKIPLIPLSLAYMGYLGYDYYQFLTDPNSMLNQVKQQTVGAQAEIDALNAKIKKVNDFAKVLSLKKLELRNLAMELETSKGSLPETLDIPDLMKTMVTEAKRAGLTVTSLRPGETKSGDYYAEQSFQFASTGIYFQYVAFLDRVANLQKIITVDNLEFSPVSSTGSKYIQLKSSIDFRAYRYVASKEDELGKDPSAAPRPASVPPTASSASAPASGKGT